MKVYADENWVTINGVHVLIDNKGVIVKGPKPLLGQNTVSISTRRGNIEDYRFSISDHSRLAEKAKKDKERKQQQQEQKREQKRELQNAGRGELYAQKEKEFIKRIEEKWELEEKFKKNEITEEELKKLGFTTSVSHDRNHKDVTHTRIVNEEYSKRAKEESQMHTKMVHFQKKLDSAKTPQQKRAIIEQIRKEGCDVNSFGDVIKGKYTPPPKSKVKIEGIVFDLNVSKDRKEAISFVKGRMSEKSQNNFFNILSNLGYDEKGKYIK